MTDVAHTGRARATARLVAAWCAAGVVLGGLGTWTVAAAAAGRGAFLPGGVFALCTAVFFVVPGGFGLRPPPREPGAPAFVAIHLPLVALRSSVWLLFAAEAAFHPLGVPALGDLPSAAQSLLTLGGLAVLSLRRTTARAVRLLLDSALTAGAGTVALWATVLADRSAGDPEPVRTAAVVLVFLLLLQLTAVVHVLVREYTRWWSLSAVAVLAAAASELLVVVSGLGGGPRTTGAAAAVLWCTGWLFSVASTFFAETLPPDGRPAADIGETRASSLAIVLVAVCLGVAVLLRPGGPGLPTGPGGAVAGLALVVALAVRDLVLGRTRVRLTTLLRRQAAVDPLTGLANRRGLADVLERVAQDRHPWVVLALDLDGFKAVNDLHGHHAGDAVLVRVADVLRDACPPEGLVARTGGDEFALVCRGTLEDGERLGARVVAAVRASVTPGAGAPLTTSVGVGTVVRAASRGGARRPSPPPVDADPLDALVEAGAALRSAKASGRDAVRVYAGAVAREHARRLLVESRLRAAIADGALYSVAQPVVDLRTRSLVAVEALARWDDPVLGTVPPSEFVPVAEATGLVGALGAAVRAHAVDGYLDVLAGSGVRLAVNVSPVELGAGGVVPELAGLLAGSGLRPHELVVEVTEAVLIERGDPALRALAGLDDLGVRVSIDDFGSGYSALGYLRRLPVSAVKIDRELLEEAVTSVRTRHIVAGVVDLAARLGVPVTVEGIEDEDGARLAVELGAVHGQGYWFSPPVPWRRLADAASPGPRGAAAG